ncbi:MAG: tetratricopeptide repeat protein [Acidobacteriales bacterium]|nr:tetratricopeptide repeat protein [Terriglobales bacterium]
MKRILSKLIGIGLLVFLAYLSLAAQVQAQETVRAKAKDLYERGRHVEALPLLEQLAMELPNDPEIQGELGFSLLAAAAAEPDIPKKRAMRVRAKKTMLRARELGNKSNLMGVADDLPDDGTEPSYSKDAALDRAMQAAESEFVKGNYAEAIAGYQRALALDPRNYHATLFIGDVLFKQKQYDQAGEWFARAIAIQPDVETAYRYWGDALKFQGKYEPAMDKFLDAVVAEPYSRSSWVGLTQWADANRVKLTQPRIDVPKYEKSADGKSNMNITLSTADDGSMGWIGYAGTRAAWEKEKFKATFPEEMAYRHSLVEEADALRSVIRLAESTAKDKKKGPNYTPQLQLLKRLIDEGMLEAWILIFNADNGISQDYDAYRQKNRPLLKAFLVKYVVGK